MGFLTPSYVREDDYDNGIGTITLTFSTSDQQEGDIFLLCVECRASQTPTDATNYPDWTYINSRENTTDGTGGGAALFAHRYDGTTLPDTTALYDTGNHTSYSLHTIRNVDRNIALTSLFTNGVKDDTPDTSMVGRQLDQSDNLNGGGTKLDDAQAAVLFFLTTGDDNHGGISGGLVTVGSGFSAGATIRSAGHTQGSDGSHCTARITKTGNGGTFSVTPTYTTTNSMDNQGLAISLPGHEYQELTRAVSDGLTAADSIGRDVDFTRAIVDALGLSDAVARTVGFTRAVADALGLSESVATVTGRVRSVADSLTLGDSVARVQGWVRGVADSLTLSEVVTTDKILYRMVADALGLSDVATRAITKFRNVTDSLTLSDSLTQVFVWGIKAVVTAVVSALTHIEDETDALTSVEDTIEPQTHVVDEVNDDDSIEIVDEVDELTHIDTEIE